MCKRGVAHFYLGDSQLAQYYHQKMVLADVQTDQQIIQLSNSKLSLRDYRNNPLKKEHI